MLAQRLRIVQAARLRAELIARHGDDGAFPPPHTLARLDPDLPGRKGEYLRAVAEAALDGLLDGRRCAPSTRPSRPARAAGQGARPVRCRAGRGPRRERPRRAARHERRLDAEIAERYGPGRTLAEVSEAWRAYRTWAAVHLRAAPAAHRRDRRPLSHHQGPPRTRSVTML